MSERSGLVPASLYAICVSRLANQACAHDTSELRALPDTILMDIYYQMLIDKELSVLGEELSDLEVFTRLLRDGGSQHRLMRCMQTVIEHGSPVTARLADAYLQRCAAHASPPPAAAASPAARTPHRDAVVRLGVVIGEFLTEAGWYCDAERVLTGCLNVCRSPARSPRRPRVCTSATLDICQRLLKTQSAYCCFPSAAKTYALALSLLGIEERVAGALGGGGGDGDDAARRLSEGIRAEIRVHESEQTSPSAPALEHLLPRLYKEFSALFFVRCDYNAAYAWSAAALAMLRPDTPASVTVEVLSSCGKACVVKRRFARAGLVMRQAVAVARRCFGPRSPKYAFALLDYGFYLLNIDSILHSVSVYEEALGILRAVFGNRNLHVATAQEDLAYALYVLEYSSGRFYKAKDHAEHAIDIIEGLVPSDHLLLASAKRVKALILEEIALDNLVGHDIMSVESNLLVESEALHKAALNLSMMAFGEKNVQTAKHYGNLGRLYQSMHKFQDAETMHLKAISIKEELLGPEDYEVGLSIGHLASLYNYHMHMYSAAEELYSRSIAISLKLFGECYSGLEYDYRGLVHVFTQLNKNDEARLYTQMLQYWHDLREHSKAEQQPTIGGEQALPLEELKQQFFGASAGGVA